MMSDPLRHARRFAYIIQRSGRMQLASDIVALTLAFVCGGMLAELADALIWQSGFFPVLNLESLKQFAIFLGMGGLALLWLDTRGHYRQRLPFWETTGNLLAVSLIGFLTSGFLQFAAHTDFSRLWLAFSWAMFGIFLFVGRGVVRRYLESKGQWQIPSIIIGQGPSADAAERALSREPGMGFAMVSKLSSEALRPLVKPHAWKRLLISHGASHIFLALDGSELQQQRAALECLVRERLPFSIVPPWIGLPTGTLSPHHFMLHDVMVLHDTNKLSLPLPRVIKRSFDIVVAGLALAVLAPVFAVLTFMVRRDGGPAFFTQERVGKGGRVFYCYKFRSMRIDAEAVLDQYLAANPDAAAEWKQFQKLKNDVRITRFGQFIRKTSMDELPQLINVLKGDMSLVGPRPIMLGQEAYYADDFIYYGSVRPGITGPWQVSGRNRLTFKERVTLEACYARNWSLWMDVVILLKTFPTVLKKEQAF